MKNFIPTDYKKFLARVFLDIVNADAVVFTFENDRLFEMLNEYGITRVDLMDAEKCTFAAALNALLKWKNEDPEFRAERQYRLEKDVLKDVCYIAMGNDRARLCSKLEASIIVAFDLVVVREKAEIFNPANPKGMNFSKDEIIYLDNAANDSRSINVNEYKQISHSARLVNSRFIYVPHVIQRFVEETNEEKMRMLLGYLFPSSLPDGPLSAADVVKSPTIDGIYKWLKSNSVSPFIYRVIGEQLFGSPADAKQDEKSHPVSGPMIVMKLRTSRVLEGEQMKNSPDFIKVTFDCPADQVAQQVNNAVNFWLEELKSYTRGFDIHIDLEAEHHFMLHTFHKNIFDAMIMGSKVESMSINLVTNTLQFDVKAKEIYKELADRQEFSFTIPLVRGEVRLYLAILLKTLISSRETNNWRGLRRISSNSDAAKESASLFTKGTSAEGQRKIKKSVELSQNILKWAFSLGDGKGSFEAASLAKNRTIINQRISQNRLLDNKAMFMINSSDQFWSIDIDRKLPVTVIIADKKTLNLKQWTSNIRVGKVKLDEFLQCVTY